MKVNTIRIRRIKNAFVVELSPFSDGSGADVFAYKTWQKVGEAVMNALAEGKKDE